MRHVGYNLVRRFDIDWDSIGMPSGCLRAPIGTLSGALGIPAGPDEILFGIQWEFYEYPIGMLSRSYWDRVEFLLTSLNASPSSPGGRREGR